MKILVTGAAGQLGYDVCERLTALGIQHQGVDRADFDISDRDAVLAYITSYAPDAIIHCAAFTAVDQAESQPELCARINVDGTKNIAEAAALTGAKMMYLSTDYVFDGQGEVAYKPEDKTAPLSVYGKTKRMGELAVLSASSHHFIVRTSWVFGRHGSNFVQTILRLGHANSQIRVVSDQIGSPTYTRDLAALLCDMICTNRFGIYHAANSGFCSRAEFAEEILRQGGLQTEVIPTHSSEHPSPARRPCNSRLNQEKLERLGFARLPHWTDALHRYLHEGN